MGLIRRRGIMGQQGGEPLPPNNEVWYWAPEQVTLYSSTGVQSHTFADGKGVLTFANPVTEMKNWLRGTSTITDVTMPDTVTSIGTYAFQSCTKLAITSLPSRVTSIGNNAFGGCTSIQSLTIDRADPPTLGSSAFNSTTFPIYVPASAVDTYKAASGWSTYASRIFAIPE